MIATGLPETITALGKRKFTRTYGYIAGTRAGRSKCFQIVGEIRVIDVGKCDNNNKEQLGRFPKEQTDVAFIASRPLITRYHTSPKAEHGDAQITGERSATGIRAKSIDRPLAMLIIPVWL